MTRAVMRTAPAVLPDDISSRLSVGEPLKMMAMVMTAVARKNQNGDVYKAQRSESLRESTPKRTMA